MLFSEKIINILNDKKVKKYVNIFMCLFIVVFIADIFITFLFPQTWNESVQKQLNNYKTVSGNSNLSAPVKGNGISREVVSFNDKKFEKSIRSILNKKDGEVVYNTDMLRIQYLDLNHMDISDIKGIQYCKNLNTLILSYNNVKSIDDIASLEKLKIIKLDNNKINLINSLENLTNLENVDLSRNEIEDISAVKNLINLKELDLSFNKIKNVQPLIELNKNDIDLIDVSKNSIESKSDLNLLSKKAKQFFDWGNK